MPGIRVGASAATNKLRINGKNVLKLMLNGVMLWVNPGEGATLVPLRGLVTALARPPAVQRGHALSVPKSSVTSLARGMLVSAGAGVAVGVPRALVSTAARAPGAAAAAIAGVPRALATAQARPPGILAGGAVTIGVPVATVSAQARGMGFVVTAGASVAVSVPRSLSTVAARNPSVAVGVSLAVPKATATALALPPSLVTFVDQGMQKAAPNQTASAWVQITGWTPMASFPGTTVTTDGIIVPAGVTVDLSAQTYRGSAHAGNQSRIKANGIVIATGAGGLREAPVSLSNYTPTTEVLLTVEAMSTSGLSDRDTVFAGANTFLTAVKVVVIPPPEPFSTDFGAATGSSRTLDGFTTFGQSGYGTLYIDAAGYASGVGTPSTPMSRAKLSQDYPAADYEVWAILADPGQLHSASAITGRITADNQTGVEFTITTTLVGINSFYNGAERFNTNPLESTGWKVRSPWGSGAGYGGSQGPNPYPELGAALVVGAKISLRCVGTTYSGYIDDVLFVTKSMPDIPLGGRPGFLMQDDCATTSATPSIPSWTGDPPPRFSSWGVTPL